MKETCRGRERERERETKEKLFPKAIRLLNENLMMG